MLASLKEGEPVNNTCDWQGHPVNSGCWYLIDRATLSAVGVEVSLTELLCQQWVLMSYWQGHPVSSGW